MTSPPRHLRAPRELSAAHAALFTSQSRFAASAQKQLLNIEFLKLLPQTLTVIKPEVKMAEKPGAKERFHMHNTLICLVQALHRHYCTIELRNGDTVSGKLSHVDG